MKKGLGIASLALALIAAIAISVSAATVVVKPSAMNGWVTAEQAPGFSKFRDPCPGNDELVSHTGAGAWYCYTGNAGTTPPPAQITQGSGWIGTNLYAGTRLDRITVLKYKAWTDDCSALWATRGTAPNLYRQLNPPRQPTVLNLLIDRNDGSGLQSYIMWRPAGSKNSGMPGSVPEGTGNATQRHWTVWQNDPNQFWLEWTDGNVATWRDNTWGGILLAYPDATIAQSAVVGWGWPAFDSPTGCALNFMFGAEANRGGGNPALPSAWQNWYRDASGMRGYIDDFTIGVDDGTGVVTETNYDYEADSAGPEVVCNTRAGLDRVSSGITPTSPWGPALGADNYTFVLYGEVCADPAPTMYGFYLTDGFKKTEVKCLSVFPDEPPVPYSYVRAHGMLQYDGGFPDGDPAPVDGSGVAKTPDLHSRLLCNRGDVTELSPSPF